MAIASYTHIEIHPQGGSFSVLAYTESSRGTDSLETLARIERVLREKLVCTTEKYALLPEKTFHKFLRELAIEIVHSHIQKTKMLPWYRRVFQAWESASIQTAAQRILNLVTPPRIFAKLPEEVLAHIFRFLTVREITGLSLVNKDGAAQATQAKIRRAREFGWQGADPAKADEHLRSFFPFIKMVEKHAIGRGSPWKLNVKSTLKILRRNKPSLPVSLIEAAIERQNWNNPELLKAMLLLYSQSPDCEQEMVLRSAAYFGFEEVLRLALSLGADVNRKDHRAPPLSWALGVGIHRSEEEVEKTVEILLSAGASVSVFADNGSLPIHFAAQSGYAKVVDLLLQHGSEVNCRGGDGLTPLSWALKTRADRPEEEIEKTVETLLKAGASLSIPANNGSLPIHFAAQSGYAKIVGFLLERGAGVNCQNYRGFTPLIWALKARADRPEEEVEKTVETLLKAGANPNIVDENGDSSLHWAAFGGRKGAISLLLLYGADPALLNDQGKTPWEVAKDQASADLCKSLGS